jgi:hypothetical protein
MLEKLIDALNRIASALEAQNAANGIEPVTPPTPADKKAAKRAKVQEKLAEQQAEAPAPAPAPVTEAVIHQKAESAPKADPTVQDLINAAQAVLASNGNDPTPLAAINGRFGVKKLREIPVTAYAEVIAELSAMLNANAPRA